MGLTAVLIWTISGRRGRIEELLISKTQRKGGRTCDVWATNPLKSELGVLRPGQIEPRRREGKDWICLAVVLPFFSRLKKLKLKRWEWGRFTPELVFLCVCLKGVWKSHIRNLSPLPLRRTVPKKCERSQKKDVYAELHCVREALPDKTLICSIIPTDLLHEMR